MCLRVCTFTCVYIYIHTCIHTCKCICFDESDAFPCTEITAPPFEVTEMGWGEFEAGIRIFFKDPDEKVRPPLLRSLLRIIATSFYVVSLTCMNDSLWIFCI